MSIKNIACAAALSAVASSSFAASQESAELQLIQVTANRVAQTPADSLAAVTVITREQIELLQATDFIDLLRGFPGIDVANTGGPGKGTSVFMRGTETDHVLVLLDGIKIGSATSGAAAFENIPVEQIERVEIVRGPRSSLYGSEALGGVIQIFTRSGSVTQFTPSLLLGVESHGGSRAQLGFQAGNQSAWYGLSVGGRRTDGIDARPQDGEPDKDGFEQWSVSGHAGVRLPAGGELNAHVLHASGDNEFDSQFTVGADSNDTRLQASGVSWKQALGDKWTLRLSGGLSKDEYTGRLEGSKTSTFNTQRRHLSLLNELKLSSTQLLVLGGERVDDEIDTSTEFPVSSRRTLAGFVQYQVDIDAHSLQAAWRYDDDESFGSRQTGSAAWAWDVADTLRIGASYGKAFRAPSFNELYFPFFGNDQLGPETAESVEFSLVGRFAQTRWDLRAYQTDIDNLISTVLVDPDNFIYQPQNVDRAQITGVEFGAQWQLDAWSIRPALTWSQPEDRSSGPNNGKTLRRRPEQSARIDIDHSLGFADWGMSVTAVGRRYEDAANSKPLAGYATLDLRLTMPLAAAWSIQLGAHNVLDKEYQTALGYQQFGATYRMNLRYQP
ncbi:MAG: TonB-dependent receptor domain-containing protein [Oceanococcus sp.]